MMKRKEAEKEIERIIDNSKFEFKVYELYDKQRIIKNTIFGDIFFMVDLDFKIKSHAIFMRFDKWNNHQIKFFDEIYGGFNQPSRISGKWNFHTDDVESLILELEERFNNLEYLSKLD